ncbi:MAG: hypothetical protein Q9201_000721 [Fulgogasparrea decipioides]
MDNPLASQSRRQEFQDTDEGLDFTSNVDVVDGHHDNVYEGTEVSEESQEEYVEVNEAVKEEMTKLENIFQAKGLKFRVIDRIGEGTFSTVYKAEDMHYDFYQNDWDIEGSNGSKWSSPPVIKRRHGCSQDPERRRRQPRYVAIKKIYVTSSPSRIQNELELLHDLQGYRSICPLITAFRHLDQVVAVLPYFRHQDFRREGNERTPCLCQDNNQSRRIKIESSKSFGQTPATGYPKNDQRPPRRANRAGTRGFRAPEVLLKCTAQTTKIDIWSAGVILLTILCQRFPFFNSADDVDALIEIASIFGQKRMKACALLHGAIFESSLPTIGEKGFQLKQIVQWSVSNHRPDEREEMELEVMECVSFLELCLEMDPRKRISARKALATEFLAEETVDDDDVDEIQ